MQIDANEYLPQFFAFPTSLQMMLSDFHKVIKRRTWNPFITLGIQIKSGYPYVHMWQSKMGGSGKSLLHLWLQTNVLTPIPTPNTVAKNKLTPIPTPIPTILTPTPVLTLLVKWSDSDSRQNFWLWLRFRLQQSKKSWLWFRLRLHLVKYGVDSSRDSGVGTAHLCWQWYLKCC